MSSNELMKTIKLLLPVVLLFTSFVSAEKLIVPKQYATIQSAIDAAVSGDQIMVAPGTYSEKLVMPSIGIQVISMQGPDATTIDATDLNGSVFLCYIDPKDKGPHANDSISGFSLTGGTGTLHPVWENHLGGAVFVLNASPTISNCIVYGNTAEFGGGGFWIQDSQSLISDIHFEENHVYKLTRGGGAMYLWSSEATVIGCTFYNNSSESGGALKCKKDGSSTITGCTFTQNLATAFGGAISIVDTSPTIEGCTFNLNEAYTYGGVISLSGNALTDIRNCIFSNNIAGITGGAVRVSESASAIEKCIFASNTALYGGGAIVVSGKNAPSTCTVSGSLFENNNGGSNGGGIHHTFVASTDVDSSTFCGNIEVPITGDWNDLGGNSMSASCSFFCGGDVDANGLVNVEDILSLLSEWGSCDGISSCFSDSNDDGSVDVNDLLMLIANWGTCG